MTKLDSILKIMEEFSKSNIDGLDVAFDDIDISLSKEPKIIHATTPVVSEVAPVVQNIVSNVTAEQVEVTKTGEAILSPIVGVFYSANSPSDEPFVTTGSKVTKGQTVCIIEAMKVMNEIKAPKDGVIANIHVTNGDVVEFEQDLMTYED